MRLDETTAHDRRSRHRHSTNGSSSQNGSSPQTNGSAKSETNGYHTNNGHSQGAIALRNKEPFFGHDREEVTRILLQSLSDLGYHGVADHLSEESGYALEIPSVAAFRNAVLDGEWDEAEALLFGTETSGLEDGGVPIGNGYEGSSLWRKSSPGRSMFSSQNGFARHGLPLAEGVDTISLKFMLRQQKYLELLERRDLNAALIVLRNELTPLRTDVARLHFLSSLVMCPSASDLRSQADWDGAEGQSRAILLSEMSTSISPSVMIPEHRLATLLTLVQEEQIFKCRYHNTDDQPSLYTDHECPADDFPLHTEIELQHHSDEVWYLEFSHDGTMLATAGKDGLVCVYDTVRWRLKHEFREHERSALGSSTNQTGSAADNRGVCYVAFSPDDQYLVSCSQNNEFVVVNVRNGQRVGHDRFDYPVTTAAWLPDSQTFVVGTQGSEKTLSLYSLRPSASDSSRVGGSSSSSVRSTEIHSWRHPPRDPDPALKDRPPRSYRITDCAVNADGTRMVATTIDNHIMVYSLDPIARYPKLTEWSMENKLTSISFSGDGRLILVNMNEGHVLALNADSGEIVCRYKGAVQKEYVIRSAFGGAGEGFVVSGSEDSRVYIWRRQTGMQVAALEGHQSGTVNAVSWHPTNPAIFASAGDDRRVRIWSSAAARRRPDTNDHHHHPHAPTSAPRRLSVGTAGFYSLGR